MSGLGEIEEWGDDEEQAVADRRRLIEHLDWVIFPGCKWWFVDQIVEAIELAAAGEDEAWIEVDVKNRRLTEVIKDWELEEWVEEAKAGRFKPRAETRSGAVSRDGTASSRLRVEGRLTCAAHVLMCSTCRR